MRKPNVVRPGIRPGSKSRTIFLVGLLFGAVHRMAAAGAFDLTTELQRQPLGIDCPSPRFSWKLAVIANTQGEPLRGQAQTAYRILIASEPDKLQESRADVWDSGRVASRNSVLVPGISGGLRSNYRYYWTVKIWDQDGNPGSYAPSVWFESGLLHQKDWTEDGAMWIESPLGPLDNSNMQAWLQYAVVPFAHLQARGPNGEVPTAEDLIKSRNKLDKMFAQKIWPATLLRRELKVSANLKSARLYICGLGYHRAYLNGTKIGDRMLPPSDTDFRTQAYYQAYDVTALLRIGQTNCLGVELVNGRWRAWPGLTPETYHDRPVLIARLELTANDGSRTVIASDETWQAGRGGIQRQGFWQGELFDANVFTPGWNKVGFDPAGWVVARNFDASRTIGPLHWDPMPPEQIIEQGPPQRQTEPVPKVFVYDFGKQLAGRARFVFHGLRKSQRVIVRYSTAMAGESSATYALPYYPGFDNTNQLPGMLLFKRRDAISYEHGPERFSPDGTVQPLRSQPGTVVYTDMFVSAGQPVETWQPDWTYVGFRYLELLGLDQPLPLTNVTGFDLRTTPRIVGELTTDNERLNRVLKGIQNTILQGFHSQLQDNNGSERNPNGVNDALNNLVMAYWFDTYPLWLKTIDNTARLSTRINWPANMIAGMRNNGGDRAKHYVLIVDCFQYGQTPLDMWRFYGDARNIQPMIPWMQSWLSETTDYTVWNHVTSYGDHIAATALNDLPMLWGHDKTAPVAFVQAATVHKVGLENIELYQAMGLSDQLSKAQGVLDQFEQKVREHFYAAATSQWLPEIRTRQQIDAALYAWKMDPAADANRLADQSVIEIQTVTKGHQITGSRLSDPLLHLLSQGGHIDEAVRLLERDEYPSLLNMINETGGNIRESWGTEDSFSQIEGLTGMGNWFYRDLVGIEPDLDAPAFKHFSLRPTIPTSINSIRFSYDSPSGTIESRFEKKGNKADWTLTVPPNANATITFPAPSLSLISESGRPVLHVAEMTAAESVGRRPSVRVLSGTYHFEFPWPSADAPALAKPLAGGTKGPSPIRWSQIPSPVIFHGDATTAYRDPAAIYHDGWFHLYFALVKIEPDKRAFSYCAWSKSQDLVHWTKPEIFTPRDQNLNFGSPGDIIRFDDEWVLCLQTYPRPRGEEFGNVDARIWTMRSKDLEHWGKPELIRVKGLGVSPAKMGRLIDPYLLEDKDEPGKWWCFWKGGLAWARDLKTWTPAGGIPECENPCVIVDHGQYVLFRSRNKPDGIGVMRSPDLIHWRDEGELTLGQKHWPWAKGRLTAGFVLDLRKEPTVGKALMFFHGSKFPEGDPRGGFDNFASLGLAWSEDLQNWNWPGKPAYLTPRQ